MIRKTVENVQEALKGVKDGMTLMLGGFGLCGIPENTISECGLRLSITDPASLLWVRVPYAKAINLACGGSIVFPKCPLGH